MPVVSVFIGILLLFFFIIYLKFDAFISFIIISIFIGIIQGMELNSIVTSIETGIGSILGFLVIILSLGAMLGKLVAESGAAQKITMGLIEAFGIKYTRWAVMLTGFIVGVTMFYSVGFVILVPLVFSVATSTGIPLISIALPMLCALSVTHGYLPPHPAPTALAILFKADMGKTLIYGFIIAIPAIIISGPILTKFLKKVNATPLKEFVSTKKFKDNELPSMSNSLMTSLSPVLIIGFSTVIIEFLDTNSFTYEFFKFLGNPVVALLIAIIISIYTLGINTGKKMSDIMKIFSSSLSGITMVLLIIAGAGALKQILIDSGVSDYVAELLQKVSLSPLILGWLIASIVRVSIGSATVAGLTTAGIVLPIVEITGVNPELMVLAVGSGSLMLSHVNDPGFWMFKEYFNLSIKDTLLTWTIMETSVGISGLIGVLLLNLII